MLKYVGTYLMGVFMLAAIVGCRQEPIVIETVTETCEGGYPLIFGYVNLGDTTVKKIDLEAKCYRINVDTSSIVYRQYESLEFDPDDQFPLSDSLIHLQYPCATPGSWKWMFVRIIQKNPDGTHIRITTWELSTTDWVYMYEPEDFTEIFHWPDDTIRYTKVYDWSPPG